MGASIAVERADPAGRDWTRPVVLLGLLVGAANLYRFRSIFHALDDAWISFRVARNWLEHGVLSYDVSRAPVEGMTNLLWTLVSASWIAIWPDGDPVIPARCLGAVLYLATLALLAGVAHRETLALGGRPLVAVGVTLGLCALSSSLAFYALSGLETPLWGLLFAAGLDRYALALRGRPGAAAAAGVLLGGLAMTRPEGVAVAGTLCCGALAVPAARRCATRLIVPCAAIILGMEAFRWITYGDLLPNTFYAKLPALQAGVRYVQSFAVLGLGGLGPLALVALRRRTSPLVRMLLVLVPLLLAGAVVSGGDWMPGFRRLTLATISLALLIGIAAALARSWLRPLAGVAVGAVLVANLVAARQIDWNAYNTPMLGALGDLAARTDGITDVALVDVGRFGWSFPGSIYDLTGLTDSHLARLPGAYGAKRWDEAYFRLRSPELVLVLAPALGRDPLDLDELRSWERQLVESMVQGGGYVYHDAVAYMEGTQILIFHRQDVELPASIWGPPARRDLLAELRS